MVMFFFCSCEGGECLVPGSFQGAYLLNKVPSRDRVYPGGRLYLGEGYREVGYAGTGYPVGSEITAVVGKRPTIERSQNSHHSSQCLHDQQDNSARDPNQWYSLQAHI